MKTIAMPLAILISGILIAAAILFHGRYHFVRDQSPTSSMVVRGDTLTGSTQRVFIGD